ncbi:hypothetical protein [Microvirgula aerodenitrificans]|uniref:hypothetical protein n=1 Tax=Microvirgula aerodenitrificans TaxID=57480 RepID=UPI0028EBD86E|nr:hypothetical protein [Microvirgula aerodenitrificans]
MAAIDQKQPLVHWKVAHIAGSVLEIFMFEEIVSFFIIRIHYDEWKSACPTRNLDQVAF